MNNHEDAATITHYLQSIAKVPLLSRPDELKYGYQMVEGRKKIAEAVGKSKKSLALLDKLVSESIDDEDEEKPVILELIRNPNKDNLKLLKEYVTHIDFGVLVKYCEHAAQAKSDLGSIRRARDILVNSNLRLVVSVAKQYTNAGLPFLDLIEEGNIGLIKAIDKFDPYRESKLSTLATWWIRQAVIRSLSNKSRVIRVPVHMVDAMNRAYKKLTEHSLRSPTPEEMMKELNMPNLDLNQVKEIMDIMVGPVALQTPVGSDDNGETTYESFLKDKTEAFDITLADADLKQKLLALLAELSPREEKIFRLKTGI